MGIYVEIRIRAPMDALWARTQEPALHERWDLRFSEITYLPRPSDLEPQRFRYATRVGFGVEIAGDGESMGERSLVDGSRTSSLAFASSSALSLIREGSGYWKYIPTSDGIRFLTWYDYRTRWGAFGTVVDRLVFRPLIGWATAWSFDRLRRWLETGADPAASARQALVHAVARLSLAFIFLYHGLVPKLLAHNADELSMLVDAGISGARAHSALMALGVLEIGVALALLATWRARWLPALILAIMPFATLGVAIASPRYLSAAFNPVTLNLGVAALAVIDVLTCMGLVTASRCLREPPPGSL